MNKSLKLINIAPTQSFTYLLQLAASIFFGLRLANEWGSDFGVYFVGGMSISSDYGLYSGFFDHKGPTYYAFIKLLSFVIPYSRLGATLVLSLTCLIWFVAISISLRMQRSARNASTIIMLMAVSVLLAQPSNSSIAIFLATLQVLALSNAIKFSKSGKNSSLIFSSIFLALAILTRIDAILVAPLVFYFVCKRRVDRSKIFIHFTLLTFSAVILLILILKEWLHFSLPEFWQQAVVFNLTEYPKWTGILGAKSHLFALMYLTKNMILNGSLLIAILSLIAYRVKLGDLVRRESFWVFLYGLFAFAFVGSGKDYHLFIFYVFLITGAILFFSEKQPARKGISLISLGCIFVSATWVVSTLVSQSSCLFTQVKCYQPYSELVSHSKKMDSRKVEFILNQGWPYLFMEKTPKVSFTPYFPLAVSVKGASDKFIESSGAKDGRVFWLSDSDIASIREFPNSRIDDFLSDKILVGSTESGFSAYSKPVSEKRN